MAAAIEAGTYRHTQGGPWWALVGVAGIVMLAVGLTVSEPAFLGVMFPVLGVLMLVLAASCATLTVADAGDRLTIRFGPLPLLGTAVYYPEIVEVAVDRTAWIEGYGIHMSLRGGWVWNIWGRDCVMIRREGRPTIWLGTDEPERLAEFLRRRMGGR